LYIVGANAANTRITQDAYGTGAYGVFTARMARGTAASPTASQSGDFLAQFTARGYGSTGFGTASTSYIAFSAAENFTDTAQGTYAGIYTTPTGSNSIVEAFRFGPAGQLGIGGATYGTSGQFLTSGGVSAAPSWTTVTLATLGGVVPVASGGTNITSYTVGDLLYASGTTTLSRLADVATGNVLLSGGVGVAPSWGQVSLTTAVTGTLPAANGGTGQSSYTIGDLLYASTTTALSKLADVATGSVLVSGGVGNAPSYSASPTLTTSLTTPLHIGGTTASSTLTLESTSGAGTTDSIIFKTGSQSIAMTIDTSQNVGIGTTPTSGSQLSTIQTTYGIFGGSSQININSNAYYNGGWKYIGTGYATLYSQNLTGSSGTHTWYYSASGTAGNAITFNEAMRIDSSGNVGIGQSAPVTKLQTGGTGANSWVWINPNTNGMSPNSSITTGLAFGGNYSAGGSEGNILYGTYLTIAKWDGTTYSEKMRIDSSGNVGIGTSSPSTKFTVQTAALTDAVRWTDNTNSTGILSTASGLSTMWTTTALGFGTGAGTYTERMRIDSSGNLLVGTTSTNPISSRTNGFTTGPVGFLTLRGSVNMALGLSGTSGTNIQFYTDNGSTYVAAGNINSSGSATSYVTGSDYRLKENVVAFENGLSLVNQMRPVSFTWKEGYGKGSYDGFIAHELAEIVPYAVSGEKDAVDEKGRIKPQGVDYSKIVVHLVAAIQEQQATITALTFRIAALEAK